MTAARPAAPGRPKDPEKRAALVEAAGRLFCENGFEAVSLEAIAQAAGVSKLTIYSHFGDKEGLFTAAVEARCEAQMPNGLFKRPVDLPLRDALLQIGQAFADLVYSDDAIQLMRTMAAQAAQTAAPTRLAQLYFAAGPKRTLEEMEGFLAAAQQRGDLRAGPAGVAAEEFFVLLKGVAHLRCLLGLQCPPNGEGRRQHVERCVETFLSAHAPEGMRP